MQNIFKTPAKVWIILCKELIIQGKECAFN